MSETPRPSGPPPLTFASIRIEREWSDGRLDRRVREVVLDAAEFLYEEFGVIADLGSIYRTNGEEADISIATGKPTTHIHVAWRAVDIRVRNLTRTMIDALVAYLKARWIYDPTRPQLDVVFAEKHGTGPHIHLQSHPLTRRR